MNISFKNQVCFDKSDSCDEPDTGMVVNIRYFTGVLK